MYQEPQPSKIKTFIDNLSHRQRVGLVIGIGVVITLIIVGVIFSLQSSELASQNGLSNSSSKDEGEDEDSDEEEDEDDDEGEDYYRYSENTPIEGGDATDINTYLPHAVYRHRDNAEYNSVQYLIEIMGEKHIEIMVEACNEEEDKQLAHQYLDSIPLDLSSYTITYDVASEDVDCEP